MSWVFFALLAPFIYAVNVFLDKYLIEARMPNYQALPIFGVILSLPISLVFWLFGGVELLNLKDSFLVILTGVFTIWAFSLYLEALIKEETSVVIILIQLIPVIVLVLSYFILGEVISSSQLLGFLLLVISSILVSIKKSRSSFKLTRSLLFIVAADILWAIPYILVKFTSRTISFDQLIMYESAGVVLGGLIMLLFISKIRDAFITTVIKIKKPVLSLVFINEGLFLIAKIITYIAVILGPVALVSVLGSTQIFYGILFGVLLTLILPKVFKEDLSKGGLLKKGALGLIAFAGVYLVS